MKYSKALENEFNYTLTENGGLAHKSTCDKLYDLFALGGAYRKRSDEDCVFLFMKAFEENPTYAMKCLFYLRDILQGQGERRFFRVCIKWAADNHTAAMKRNLRHIPEFGRWDDLYAFVNTKLEQDMWDFMREQYLLDIQSRTPSLLGKWLKSENTSSAESRALGAKTRKAFGITPAAYRKSLSSLRKRINVLERLMSEGRWDEIEFDKIPSKAGMVYRNAFARHDVERMKNKTVQSYADFAKDKTVKVNAKALYPYEVVSKAYNYTHNGTSWYYRGREATNFNDTERLMINKYWDNLAEYISKLNMNALCVVDTSGSMWGTQASAPINIAISLGMIAADKARGPFHGQYISFSSHPQLIKVEGVDFVDKVRRIYETNLCENTNLEATFDMLLNVAIQNRVKQKDLPKSIIVISDMQIDSSYRYSRNNRGQIRTMMENMRLKWKRAGYDLPKMVYWCVDSRRDTFLDDGPNVTYVSGSSAVLFEQIAKGVTAQDLMFEKLDSKRYSVIE